MGTYGELRYLSYQLAGWNFPGCGTFQSFDSVFSAKLAADAAAFWSAPFWTEGGNDAWDSDYG
jgi:hypothetical protein